MYIVIYIYIYIILFSTFSGSHCTTKQVKRCQPPFICTLLVRALLESSNLSHLKISLSLCKRSKLYECLINYLKPYHIHRHGPVMPLCDIHMHTNNKKERSSRSWCLFCLLYLSLYYKWGYNSVKYTTTFGWFSSHRSSC